MIELYLAITQYRTYGEIIMSNIRKAQIQDISRIAEILIFTKRVHYRSIFHNDIVSFKEMQVLSLANEYLSDMSKIKNIWVYDDEFVKGLLRIESSAIEELYIDTFFQGLGIGSQLIEYAIHEFNADRLWVLEKNHPAIEFYQKHGFVLTSNRKLETGTTEYIVEMKR